MEMGLVFDETAGFSLFVEVDVAEFDEVIVWGLVLLGKSTAAVWEGTARVFAMVAQFPG